MHKNKLDFCHFFVNSVVLVRRDKCESLGVITFRPIRRIKGKKSPARLRSFRHLLSINTTANLNKQKKKASISSLSSSDFRLFYF